MNIKKTAIKKWGHRACLHVSGLLKWGIFTGCGTSLGYPKDTKFYLEIKASFIDISNIASFKLFLIAWWLAWSPGARFSKVPKTFRARKAIAKYPTLRLQSSFIHIFLIWTEVFFIQEVSGVNNSPVLDTDELKMALRARKVFGAFEKRAPGLGENATSRGLFSKKNNVLLSNFFSSSNMFFIRLFLVNTWKKFGGHRARLRRKGAFISLSSLVWGKSLTFCTRARSCARDAKIVRSRDAQCNTKELP